MDYKLITFLDGAFPPSSSSSSFTTKECYDILRLLFKASAIHKFSKHTEVALISSQFVCFIDLHSHTLDESKFVCYQVVQKCPDFHKQYQPLTSIHLSTPLSQCVSDCLPSLATVLKVKEREWNTYFVKDLYRLNSKRLFNLLHKITGEWNRQVEKLVLSGASDVDILRTVTTCFVNRTVLDSTDDFKVRARIREFKELVSTRLEKFLDFGGGCGDFVHGLASEGLIGAAHCLDLKTWFSKEHQAKYTDVQYTFVNTVKLAATLPCDSFDGISVLQVIHHLDEPRESLHELYRILRPGGVLFIREHDCQTEEDRLCIDLEHLVHEVSFRKNYGVCCTYQANYLSQTGLYAMLADVGFTFVKESCKRGVTNCYYCAWTKQQAYRVF